MPTTLLMTLLLLAAPAEEPPRDDGGGLVAVGLRVGGGSWTYDYAAPLVGIGLNAGHRHRALEAGVTVGLHWLSANLDLYGKLWLGRLNLSVGAGVNVIQLVTAAPSAFLGVGYVFGSGPSLSGLSVGLEARLGLNPTGYDAFHPRLLILQLGYQFDLAR